MRLVAHTCRVELSRSMLDASLMSRTTHDACMLCTSVQALPSRHLHSHTHTGAHTHTHANASLFSVV